MDSHPKLHHLFLVFSLLFLHQIKGEESGSVFFLDGLRHQFFRSHSSNNGKSGSRSLVMDDIGAAVSVLLGFAPPVYLSPDSSSKLSELLFPNPFYKPSAVVLLEVKGIEQDTNLFEDYIATAELGSAIKSKLLPGSSRADIQLPDDEVSVIDLDEPLGSECTDVCMSKELQDFASWLGGSYDSSTEEPLNGKLTVTLASGTVLYLDMSKPADREFAVSLLSLVHNIRKAVEMQEVLSRGMQSPPELMTGCFTGLKTLQEQYGPDGVSQQGMELFLTTLTKLFSTLQDAYKGEVVGVVFSTVKPYRESESMFSLKFTSRRSSRWLGESESPIDSIVAVLLVRRILTWVAGIVLLISTFLGFYFLLNMPITRDTLLYSNVKLD